MESSSWIGSAFSNCSSRWIRCNPVLTITDAAPNEAVPVVRDEAEALVIAALEDEIKVGTLGNVKVVTPLVLALTTVLTLVVVP